MSNVSVACFMDSTTRRSYLLRLIDRQVGTGIFEKTAKRNSFVPLDAKREINVQHLPLSIFVAKMMVLDTVTLSPEARGILV
jgi:hypothetical protein